MKDIFYVNSRGIVLDLLEPPYLLQTGELFDYAWSYESVDKSAVSSHITGFKKEIKEIPLTLSILNYSRESYETAIDKFFETVEYDVINKTPGELHIGEQYLQCYVITSAKTGWEYDIELLDNDIKLVAERPAWVTEQNITFKPSTGDQLGEYLDFPFDVPFDLTGDGSGIGNITFNHYAACDFLLTVYGPCTNPRITIGDNLYMIKTKLDAGEYLLVDSRECTVVRVRTNGIIVNEFGNRETKTGSVFAKIQPGYNLVSWDGSFGFDVLLYLERSEPSWKK